MEIQEIIDILTKFKEGKTIQMECEYRNEKGECYFRWTDCNTLESILSNVKFAERMRVKPEPHYRPYMNADEFIKASQEHGEWIKCPADTKRYRPTTCGEIGVRFVDMHSNSTTMVEYPELLKNYIWFDGTKCGIQEIKTI